MMISMETWLRQGQRKLKQWALDPRVQEGVKIAAYGGGGFLLSALPLAGAAQPVALGLVTAVERRRTPVTALGAILGYRFFWGSAGWQGMVWVLGGLLLLLLRHSHRWPDLPLLLPALAGVWAGVVGLLSLGLGGSRDPFFVLCLRPPIAALSVWYFPRVFSRRDPLETWVTGAITVMCLSGAAPHPFWNPGAAAVGVILMTGSFPAAALAGLGLDLTGVTASSVTAAACGGYFLRCLPWSRHQLRALAPALGWLGLCALTGVWDFSLMPGLLAGGALGLCLPPRVEGLRRPGQTGVAQVRLEITAGVLSRIQQLLLEGEIPPPDQEALLEKARSLGCAGCPSRNVCRDCARLRLGHLHNPGNFSCAHPGRIRAALASSAEQLKNLKAERARLGEYRFALIQQYQFLAEYLRRLSDQLPRRGERPHAYYRLEAAVRSTTKETANGDRFFAFPGTGCRYYLLLCDGMGTGLGAAREGQSAGDLLRQLLCAGFPAEYAVRTLNSLLLLRGQAGAVTVDLAEIRLDTGRISLYKWGAAPSYALRRSGAEKIGTATPPPGISMTEARETVIRLSLHRGEALILVSDGAQIGEKVSRMEFAPEAPPGELAQKLLEQKTGQEDDATVVVARLRPRHPAA